MNQTPDTAQRPEQPVVATGPLLGSGVFSRSWGGLALAVAFLPLFLFVFMLTAESYDQTLADWTKKNFGRPFFDEPNGSHEPRGK